MKAGNGSVHNTGGTSRGALQGWSGLASALGIILLVLAIFYVWLRVQQVRDGYRLAEFQVEQREQYDLHRKLELEWSSLHDPAYLERLGRNRLGLSPPHADQQFFVPRSRK